MTTRMSTRIGTNMAKMRRIRPRIVRIVHKSEPNMAESPKKGFSFSGVLIWVCNCIHLTCTFSFDLCTPWKIMIFSLPNSCWMMTVCRTRLLQDDAIEKCYIVGCYTYRQNGANLKASLQAYSQSVYIREALRVILAF